MLLCNYCRFYQQFFISFCLLFPYLKSVFVHLIIEFIFKALRFEMFENSSLAAYLLHLSAEDRRFAFEIYWYVASVSVINVWRCVFNRVCTYCSLFFKCSKSEL